MATDGHASTVRTFGVPQERKVVSQWVEEVPAVNEFRCRCHRWSSGRSASGAANKSRDKGRVGRRWEVGESQVELGDGATRWRA